MVLAKLVRVPVPRFFLLSFLSARLHCLLGVYSCLLFTSLCCVCRVSVSCYRTLHSNDCGNIDHSPVLLAKMFSLIRKISNSQQPKDNMEQPARTNDAKDKHEDKQKEEVDGTTYDPGADPRDPGRYYTFPHFAEEYVFDSPQSLSLDTTTFTRPSCLSKAMTDKI